MTGESHRRDTFQPGDLLNNTYRIERILGRGGTSEVYRARSEISGRVVALKALRAEFARNEDYLVLMTREEDIREIRHDSIVRYFDNQRTDDGTVFLVMDYIDGPGLDAKLKQGGMSADDLLIIARRVAEGLQAAHARKIVHRDLSPDNIILRGGDPADAVIIDFGIAKDTNPGAQTIVGNDFAGKFAYAAPEQLSGESDERSDIYALGALLLAGFRGKQPDVGGNPSEIIKGKAHPLDTSGVPEPLKSLIDRMTHPDREKRLQSAAAVVAEIDAATARSPASPDDAEQTVIAPRPVERTAPPSATSSAPASGPPPEADRSSRKGRTPLVAGLALVLAAAVAAGLYLSGTLDGILGPRLPRADPYTLTLERDADGTLSANGHVPSEDIQAALSRRISAAGGTARLTLAGGDIAESWGTDLLALIERLQGLPEWRIEASGNTVQVTALSNDRAEHDRIAAVFADEGMPGALRGEAEITLGPRILSPATLRPILDQHADCGALRLADPPSVGYEMGARIVVTGRVAQPQTRITLEDAIARVAGNRDVDVNAEVLNPTLCKIDAALPQAPSGGFEITFGFGTSKDNNPTGRYLVGENPVIDVTIPADVTRGYLLVSALDVSGSVFHMLPNLNRPENSIAALRDGAEGPVTVRVAYSETEAAAANGKKLAFVVDDSSLGKTRIVVLHASEPVFDGLRPTTESASSFVQALENRRGQIDTMDSRILTTAKP